MWFEARKQEKKIRSIMIDHKKRAERRQEFYERIKRDPAEFMQIHGTRYKIQVDLNVSKDYENAALRPLQGDSSTLIDRFDARAHLDYIPEYKGGDSEEEIIEDQKEREESGRCLFERYRILVVNEFEKTSEDKFLKQIYQEEHYGTPQHHSASKLAKQESEKKKKMAEQKAAIAFTYEDGSDTLKGRQEEEGSSSGSEEESETEFDITLDVEGLTPEECRTLSKIAAKYSMEEGDFVKCMWEDKMEQEEMEEQKKLEEARSSLSGKKSRRERQMLKQERLLMISGTRDFTTNLSYAKVESPSQSRNCRSSSSRSPSPSADKKLEKIEYITSFGGEKESDEGENVTVHGPAAPPPEYRRLSELRKNRSLSPDFGPKLAKRRSSRSRSRSRNSRVKRRSRSRDNRDRDRGRYRGYSGRRRSRSRSSSRRGSRRYPASRDYDNRSRPRSSTSRRSRSRSRDKRYRRRSYSRSPRRSTSHKSSGRVEQAERPPPKQNVDAEVKVKKVSPEKVVVAEKEEPVAERSVEELEEREKEREEQEGGESSEYSDSGSSTSSMFSIRSSMSESEQERREVENRRKRVKKTKRNHRLGKSKSKKESEEKPADTSVLDSTDKGLKQLSVREKLKLQTQKALKRTVAKDKEDALERKREAIKGQIEREEEMREISSLMRKKSV